MTKHLFSDCPLVKNIRKLFCPPWKYKDLNKMMLLQAVSRFEVSLLLENEATAAQIWTIVRGCILRVCWLGRTLQVFNPGDSGIQWLEGVNQAVMDIQAHLNSKNADFQVNGK